MSRAIIVGKLAKYGIVMEKYDALKISTLKDILAAAEKNNEDFKSIKEQRAIVKKIDLKNEEAPAFQKLKKKDITDLSKMPLVDLKHMTKDWFREPTARVKKGVWTVTFTLKLFIEDPSGGSYATISMREDHTAKRLENENDIVKKMVEDYIESVRPDYETEAVVESIKDVKFSPKINININDILNKGLDYKMFPDVTVNEGECGLDMIMAAVPWKTYSREDLKRDLRTVSNPKYDFSKGISNKMVIAWAALKKTVTCIAINPFMETHGLESITAQHDRKTELFMVYIVNNNHFYPVTDRDQKRIASKTQKLDFTKMQFCHGKEDWSHTTMAELMSEPPPTTKLVHVETNDLNQLLNYMIETTGFNPAGIACTGPFITSFQNPITNQIYIASPDFYARKECCEVSAKETNFIEFAWNNQSYAEIFSAWTKYYIGEIPESFYSEDSLMIRERYPVSASIGMSREILSEEKPLIESYDYVKCYTSLMIENTAPFPIESVFDDIVPYVAADHNNKLPIGNAFISKNIKLGSIEYPAGSHPSVFVQKCLDAEMITLSDVTHVQIAARAIAGNTFSELTKKLVEMFPKIYKKIINMGIGSFGRRYKRDGHVAITDSWETAVSMTSDDQPPTKLSSIGKNWIMRRENKTLLYSGFVAIREHIVSMGNWKLFEMEKLVADELSEVVAWNTDSIKVIRPRASFIPTDKTMARPGDITREDTCKLRGTVGLRQVEAYNHTDIEWRRVRDIDMKMMDLERTEGMMATGHPGTGKSYILQKMASSDAEDELKIVKLAWTKTAALNINGETLDHVFPQSNMRQEWIAKALTYKVLYFDEFSIIPEFWWSVFLEIKLKRPSMIFVMMGDPLQLHSKNYEDKQSKMWFRYDRSKLMHRLCDGNMRVMKYLEETARYDADMKARLDDFEHSQTLDAFAKSKLFTPEECLFTITKSDHMREKINQTWAKALMPNNTWDCRGKKGNLRLWVGMFLISHLNEAPIVNSTRYLVTDIHNELTTTHGIVPMVTLMNVNDQKSFSVSMSKIGASCRYGYADTVMRTISRTIVGKFNIMESDKMDWNEMFVALSRAKSFSMIGLSKNRSPRYEMAEPPARGQIQKIKHELFNGELYQRTDEVGNIYTGSTNDSKRRESEHSAEPVSEKVRAWEASGVKIDFKVLEKWICSSKRQLVKREYQFIAKVPRELCMNTCGLQSTAVEACTTKLETVTAECSRFVITDDTDKKIFRLRWTDEFGKRQEKRVSYLVKSKAVQLAATEEFRRELIKKYFI